MTAATRWWGCRWRPRSSLIATQPDSAPILRWMGFQRVTEAPIIDSGGVRLTRTAGRHTRRSPGQDPGARLRLCRRGTGRATGADRGRFRLVRRARRSPTDHRSDVIVVNAGAARIGGSLPISMDTADVIGTARAAPRAPLSPFISRGGRTVRCGGRSSSPSCRRRISLPVYRSPKTAGYSTSTARRCGRSSSAGVSRPLPLRSNSGHLRAA
jgi:hypothetical protein